MPVIDFGNFVAASRHVTLVHWPGPDTRWEEPEISTVWLKGVDYSFIGHEEEGSRSHRAALREAGFIDVRCTYASNGAWDRGDRYLALLNPEHLLCYRRDDDNRAFIHIEAKGWVNSMYVELTPELHERFLAALR